MSNGKPVGSRVLLGVFFAVLCAGLGLSGCGSGSGSNSEGSTPAACSTPATGPITLSLVASRLSGVAPLAVFFDATGTTTTVKTRPFHDLEYRWDFGDPGSGNWRPTDGSATGRSRNLATGPVATHVFESPGTYTIAMTALNGTNTASSSCVQITVQDPAAVFSGANTTCFSTSNNFTGCPAGARQIMTSDFVQVATFGAANRRLLLRRGETWTAAAPAVIAVPGPAIVGAIGAG